MSNPKCDCYWILKKSITRRSAVKCVIIKSVFLKLTVIYSQTDIKVAAIHDHSNYPNTLGMGEVIAVLNGVEFRTRHNDYKLNKPSTSTKTYGATDEISFPDVPPEVCWFILTK